MEAVGRHGAGSIVRRKDGRLMASITMPNGRRLYRYIPADRDKQRQRRLAAKALRDLAEIRARELEPERQTLAEYLRSWLETLRNARLRRPRPRTLEHYEYVIERHVIPTLGAHRLDALRERHVQEWLDADSGSARSVLHHHAVLRRALNVAVRQRILGRNPALAVELPDAPAFDGSPLSIEDARRLLAVPDRLAPLWRLALATGLRESELLGLAWDDVDLDAGTVRVVAQLYRAEGKWQRVPPKAARSREVIGIDSATVSVLREHKRAMAEERTPSWRFHGLVFVTPAGEPYGRAAILRAFHAACDRAGIPRRRFHDLRYSSATMLKELGVAEDARMARMGHSTLAMARKYAHPSDAADREAADALGRALG